MKGGRRADGATVGFRGEETKNERREKIAGVLNTLVRSSERFSRSSV